MFFRSGALCVLLLTAISCLRIEVAPLPVGRSTPSGARAKSGLVEIAGSDQLHRADFARAFPSSRSPLARLFGSRVSNSTGSPAELLRPALEDVVASRRDPSAAGPARLQLEVVELEWRPPQEFIQTPQARRAGRVVARLEGWWRWAPDRVQGPVRVQLSEEVFPGQEGTMMGVLMHRALAELLEQVAALR